MDSNYDVSCIDAWEFGNGTAGSVIYYWNPTTEMLEKLSPPTLLPGEAYSDYVLRLTDGTGIPQWVNTTGLNTAVVGRWTFPASPATSAGSPQALALSNVYAGSPAGRFVGATTIQVSVTSQVTAIASANIEPGGPFQESGLTWFLNGSEVAGSYNEVFSHSNSASPSSVSMWAGQLTPGDSLALYHKTSAGTPSSNPGSVIVNSL